jgi:6-phosphofructo-2-kinase/fructose-2,6-biphosphatase
VVSHRFLFPDLIQEGSAATLELDLEHYVVPSPPTAPPNGYAANLAATPASMIQTGASWTNDILLSDGIQSPSSVSAKLEDRSNNKKVGCYLEKWV